MKNKGLLNVYPSSNEQLTVIKAFLKALKIKFEFSKEETYNPEFVASILHGKKTYTSVKE